MRINNKTDNKKKVLSNLAKIFKWIIISIFCVIIIFIITIGIMLYLFFREDPKYTDSYNTNRKAIAKMEKDYKTIIGLSKAQIVEILGEPDVTLIKDIDHNFEIYDDFSEQGADEYIYYIIGESLFSKRIYIIGFKDNVVVGAHSGVEDW